MKDRPTLSVVVVASDSYRLIRRTVEHLRAQTIQDQIELVVVARAGALSEVAPEQFDGFWDVQVVEVDSVANIDRAQAPGIRAARADLVALVEDHAYPAPDWAEALVAAYASGPWSAVGSSIANANPNSTMSWANLLIGYGTAGWVDPIRAGEVDGLPNHNVSYRRDVLLAHDSELEDLLVRGSGFHERLRAEGHRFYLAPARVYHVNPSLPSSVWALRFAAGRLYGAQRAEGERWSAAKRAAYAAGSPLIPLVRLRRFKRDLFDEGPHGALWKRVAPASLFGFVADAAGQAAGYLAGAGDAPHQLAEFEFHRMRHVTEADRAEILA